MQTWDPDKYRQQAGFVANDLGSDLIEVLKPQAGETIVDIGCGDGEASKRIEDHGATIWGFDTSPEQIAAARDLGLNVTVANAQDFQAPYLMDAAFSNATFHWVKDANAALKQTAAALKPNARFVCECGGAGNIKTLVNALTNILPQFGRDFTSRSPWYFRSPEEYASLLEKNGFSIQSMQHFPRPVTLVDNAGTWFDTFCGDFLGGLPAQDYQSAITALTNYCEPKLKQADGTWLADYVRVRFVAIRN